MEKYREQGILKGKIAQLDPQKLGLGLTTITEIHADDDGPGYEEVAENLSDLSGVHHIFITFN
jgi:Lrp/AsnC family leucine-responsive transcriptional regulator